MKRTALAASISAVALLVSGQATAQSASQAAPLRIGADVSGALDAEDPALGQDDDRYSYDDYALSLRAGQRIEAIFRAESFDAYLELFAADDLDDAVASDDDGLDEGTDSRLRFTAPAAGNYVLRARSLTGVAGGDYTLALTERPPAPRAPRPGTIRKGAAVDGELTSRDPETDEGGRYDAFVFRAAPGERFAITLDSESFDPLVRVGQMDGGVFNEIAQNDDKPGGGLGSYLVFTGPAQGEYMIRVTAFDENAEGDYRLRLAEGPAALATTPLTFDTPVEGDLKAGGAVNDDGEPADAYAFTVEAGQRVAVTLDSEAFDTYLELFGPDGVSLAEDDDGGKDGTNSRIERTLTTAGTYVVQARALGEGAGAYVLTLKQAAALPEAAPLAFGETLQGEIPEEGPRDDEGRVFVAYRFQGTEGGRAQIIGRSGDFDTFLQLGRPGDAFESLASDDDGLGEGTDSRLTFTLPETGEYEVRVSPLTVDEKGLFSVELLDKGPQPKTGGILIGVTARGTLSDTDAVTDEGVYYDAYRVQVADDEKLVLILASNDFDGFVEIGREGDDGAFESLVSDDDSLSDTHAKLEWTSDSAGTYVVRARSFAPSETGHYALTVERKP